jgi:hypothetical protein
LGELHGTHGVNLHNAPDVPCEQRDDLSRTLYDLS